MVGKCRYCYSPAVTGKISHRLTIADRYRRWKRKKQRIDVYMVTGYFQPVWVRR